LNHDAGKVRTKDHNKENMMKIREKERWARAKKCEEQRKAMQSEFKLKEFQNVPSTVAKAAKDSEAEQREKREFLKKDGGLRAADVVAPPQRKEKVEEPVEVAAPKPSVPKATEASRGVSFAPEPVNHIAANKAAAAKAKPQKPAVEERIQHTFGKVPDYLVDRKKELEREEMAREAAGQRSEVPPGYKMLPESERQETLATLQKKLQEAEAAFQKLPFKIETVGQKKREADLQKTIKECEAAIKVFSKPKVLVEL